MKNLIVTGNMQLDRNNAISVHETLGKFVPIAPQTVRLMKMGKGMLHAQNVQ